MTTVNRTDSPDGTHTDIFVCGCVHTRGKDGNWVYDRCRLHENADKLYRDGVDIHKALGVALLHEIELS